MGRETVKAIMAESDLQLVAAVDPNYVGEDSGALAGRSNGIPISGRLSEVLQDADVMVDFTVPTMAYTQALEAIEAKVRPVIGTTGLTPAEIETLNGKCQERQLGGLVVPNFAIGALLMMKFAQQAARYFSNAEIIELHHNQKADAPSGTAIKTAELMLANCPEFGADNAPEVEKLPHARGAECGGIHIHSVRLPGLVAHQEVIFGGKGQTLTLRHDSISRESFMPGVMLAIREAMKLDHLLYGLDSLI